MARRVLWDADKTGIQTLAAAGISLATVQSTLASQDIDGMTLMRMVGTFAFRSQTVSQSFGWVHVMWLVAMDALDAADITASDFDSNGFGAYHTEDIPFTGYASDSTSLADQRPLSIVRFDTSNMRKIRQDQNIQIAVQADAAVGIEFSATTRTLMKLA